MSRLPHSRIYTVLPGPPVPVTQPDTLMLLKKPSNPAKRTVLSLYGFTKLDKQGLNVI